MKGLINRIIILLIIGCSPTATTFANADQSYPHLDITYISDHELEAPRSLYDYKTKELNIFSLEQPTETMKDAIASYKHMESYKPHQVVFVSVEVPLTSESLCTNETDDMYDCEWVLPLLSCTDFHLSGDVNENPGKAIHVGIEAQCRPILIMRGNVQQAQHRTVYCDHSHYLRYGFYAIRYLRGHFGQLFYEATPALVDANRAWATLEKHKHSITCS